MCNSIFRVEISQKRYRAPGETATGRHRGFFLFLVVILRLQRTLGGKFAENTYPDSHRWIICFREVVLSLLISCLPSFSNAIVQSQKLKNRIMRGPNTCAELKVVVVVLFASTGSAVEGVRHRGLFAIIDRSRIVDAQLRMHYRGNGGCFLASLRSTCFRRSYIAFESPLTTTIR